MKTLIRTLSHSGPISIFGAGTANYIGGFGSSFLHLMTSTSAIAIGAGAGPLGGTCTI